MCQDIVSGGMHCFIGGQPHDILKTSTLGTHMVKTLSIPLGVEWLKGQGLSSRFGPHCVPLISFGDGSLFSTNVPEGFYLSRWLFESRTPAPAVILVTNNNYSISLNTRNFAGSVWPGMAGVPVHQVDLNDVVELSRTAYEATQQAVSEQRVVAIVCKTHRPDPHASTDPHERYRSPEEVQQQREEAPMLDLLGQAMATRAVFRSELKDWYSEIEEKMIDAFDRAHSEPKLSTTGQILSRLRSRFPETEPITVNGLSQLSPLVRKTIGREVTWREAFQSCFDELLSTLPNLIVIGEDIKFGGYYQQFADLPAQYPGRFIDIPPNEGALAQMAAGLSTAGCLVVVAMPYNEYNYAAAIEMREIASLHALTDGRQSSGMVFVYPEGQSQWGGNFHSGNSRQMDPGSTHLIAHTPTSLVEGWRFAVSYAARGGVVHMPFPTIEMKARRDSSIATPYPTPSSMLNPHQVTLLGKGDSEIAIVAAGSGVGKAQAALLTSFPDMHISIVALEMLYPTPDGLFKALARYNKVLYVDDMQDGVVMSRIAKDVVNSGHRARFRVAAMPGTPHALGPANALTFVQPEHIAQELAKLLED